MSIDVDDSVVKISAGIYGDDRMTWDTIEAATSALSQLVAEVERLRGERAAVVAWLRGCAGVAADVPIVAKNFESAASAIERGEHRREEEK